MWKLKENSNHNRKVYTPKVLTENLATHHLRYCSPKLFIHVNACTFKGVGCSVTAEEFFELSSSKFNILPSRNNESQWTFVAHPLQQNCKTWLGFLFQCELHHPRRSFHQNHQQTTHTLRTLCWQIYCWEIKRKLDQNL